MVYQLLHHYRCDRCGTDKDVEVLPPAPRPLSSDVVAQAIASTRIPLPPGMDHKPPHGWTTVQRRVLDPDSTADRDNDYTICQACAQAFWDFMHDPT